MVIDQNKVMHVEWNIHKKCPRLYYENLPDLDHYKVHALKSKNMLFLEFTILQPHIFVIIALFSQFLEKHFKKLSKRSVPITRTFKTKSHSQFRST